LNTRMGDHDTRSLAAMQGYEISCICMAGKTAGDVP